jgi:hypothetical protein
MKGVESTTVCANSADKLHLAASTLTIGKTQRAVSNETQARETEAIHAAQNGSEQQFSKSIFESAKVRTRRSNSQ